MARARALRPVSILLVFAENLVGSSNDKSVARSTGWRSMGVPVNAHILSALMSRNSRTILA